jgi:small-conductance mechanosensitive channel
MKLLYQAWLANDAYDWLLAASIFVLVLLALALARSVLRRVLAVIAARARTGLDEIVVHVVNGTKLWLLFPAALDAGTSVLEMAPQLGRFTNTFALVAIIAQAAVWLNRFIVAWIRRQIGRRADGETITALSMISFVAQILVWVLAALLVLDQLAFDITALVAGLGIGGIAVALAVQNILGDLLASLSIVLDKPFVVGDTIAVGEDRGIVEHIGIKTTRVRAPSGQTIVFSNNDLLKSRIHNYKRNADRRIAMKLEIVYDTRLDTLERIPGLIRRAVESQQHTRFERAHLRECGASGYVFEIVYFATDADLAGLLDVQQTVTLEIIRTFERENIQLAYPSQTLFIRTQNLDSARTEPLARQLRRLSST